MRKEKTNRMKQKEMNCSRYRQSQQIIRKIKKNKIATEDDVKEMFFFLEKGIRTKKRRKSNKRHTETN